MASVDFEETLSGGHPNSLGDTIVVVDQVLTDRSRLVELLDCYRSDDPVVRLRVSSALKRVTAAQPDWVVPHLDRLLTSVAAIDQASTQWTLALVFAMLRDRMTRPQQTAALAVMRANLESSDDWIVQNTTMQVLADWAVGDEPLARWLIPHLDRLEASPRRSVSARARKLRATL